MKPINETTIPVPTEHQEQVDFFNRVRCLMPIHPELGLMFAVPNGEHRNMSVAKRLKAEGVKPGVPDIVLPVARGKYHGLYIEMKRRPYRDKRGHRVTPGPKPEQRFFIESLVEQGYRAVVRNGSDDAFEALMEYLEFGASEGR